MVREQAELLAAPRAQIQHLQPLERGQRVAEAGHDWPVKVAGETAANLGGLAGIRIVNLAARSFLVRSLEAPKEKINLTAFLCVCPVLPFLIPFAGFTEGPESGHAAAFPLFLNPPIC